MSIHKDKTRSKPYYVKYQRKTYRGFKTKNEAVQFELELISNNGVYKTKEDYINIDTLASEYLKYLKLNLSYGTYMKNVNFINNIILPNIDKKIICNYNEKDCLNFRNYVQSLDYSTRYKNNILTAFKAMFNFAKKYYGLQNNPTLVIDKIKQSFDEKMEDYERQGNVWTYDDFNQFISYVNDYKYKVLFSILFYTGMRLGECLALTWNDLMDNKISITKNITRKTENKIYELKSPKTKNSIRTITIDDNLKKILYDFKDSEMMTSGFKEDWFIFWRLRPLPQTTIDRVKEEAIKKSGVKRIRIHDLRHSFATNLINNGVNIVAVSKALGHSTITQTLNTYTHLLQKSDDEMIKVLNENSTNVLQMFSKYQKG